MKITALCPTYFRANCLFDSIYCFLKQTHTDKQLLICDDTGSYQPLTYKGVQVVPVNKTFRFDKLLRPVVKAVGGLDNLDFTILNSALSG